MEYELPPGSRALRASAAAWPWRHATHATFVDAHGSIYHWTSRQHRKGLYPELITTRHTLAGVHPPRLAPIWPGYPFRDLSYWVALAFTAGCIAWVVNGHYALQPYRAAAAAGVNGEAQAQFVAAVAALVGGTLFEVGSWLMYFEALNQHPRIDTGKQVQQQQRQRQQGGQVLARAASGQRGAPAGVQQDLEEQQPLLLLVPVANVRPSLLAQQQQQQQQQQGQQRPSSQQSVAVSTRTGRMRQLLLRLFGVASAPPDPGPGDSAAGWDTAGGRSSATEPHGCSQASALELQHHQRQHQQHCWRQRQLPGPGAATTLPSAPSGNGTCDHPLHAPAPAPAAAPADPGAPACRGTDGQATPRPTKPSSADPGPKQVLPATSPPPPAWQDAPGKQHQQQQQQQQQGWVWFGLRLHNQGFTAALLQLIGATIFWVPCIFGAPAAYAPEGPGNYAVWDGAYWGLQVAGASFFILSSGLLMLEEQPAWWWPTPGRIGWQVGLWNLVGGGFLLSGAFGLLAAPAGRLQLGGTVASTFWGSYAFLIGSYLQLLEAVNKHPESLQWRRAGSA